MTKRKVTVVIAIALAVAGCSDRPSELVMTLDETPELNAAAINAQRICDDAKLNYENHPENVQIKEHKIDSCRAAIAIKKLLHDANVGKNLASD